MRIGMLGTVWFLGLATFVQAQTPALKVRPVGLDVGKPLTADESKIVFGLTGTSIRTLIEVPGRFMLAVNGDGSKVTTFVDDLGTDLTKAKSSAGFSPDKIETYTFKTTPKGDVGFLRFTAAGTPASGAKNITVKGVLSIDCGADPKTHEVKEFAVKIDPKENPDAPKTSLAGDISVRFHPSFGGRTAVVVDSPRPNLKGIEILDASGKAIKLEEAGRGRYGFNKKYTYSNRLSAEKLPEKVTLKLSYYDKIETIEAPFEFTVGVGL